MANAPALLLLLSCSLWFAACAAPPAPAPAAAGAAGTLLLVGGGLDDDSPVWGHFVALAGRAGPPRFVIVTAATGPEDEEATDKAEALRLWAPGAPVAIVRRATPTAETVAAIDAATALFFTGGDQQRITDRYRPGDRAGPERDAMQRLLARGGTIAGASAGDAMMGNVMFLGGSSARALGAPRQPGEDAGGADGPRLAPGMHFLPWAMTDSHFFERDRTGRLVAGLEASGTRLGLGVGEDAAVAIDLATGTATGVSAAESLLVDAASLRRDGLSRRGLVARVLRQGDTVALRERLAAPPPAPPNLPAGTAVRLVPVVEPGQNRQLASWRVFRGALPGAGIQRLPLGGWAIEAWAAGGGEVAFDLVVGP